MHGEDFYHDCNDFKSISANIIIFASPSHGEHIIRCKEVMNYGSNADGCISCNWAEQVSIYLGVLSYDNADVGITTPLCELRQLMPNDVRMLVHHDGLVSSGRNCIKLSLDDAYGADNWISVKLTISNGYAITAWGEITSSLMPPM
eukprot:scaffold2313_cov88-Skeletonema_dohrnii-CCMP3373.AAC.5